MMQDFSNEKYLKAQFYQVDGKYERLEESHRQIDIDFKEIEKYLANINNVLDIGCFDGYFLSKIDCELKFGLDINLVNIDKCQDRGIPSLVCDIRYGLPEFIDEFDFINFRHTLEHIPRHKQKKVMADICSRLSDNGVLSVIIPIENLKEMTYKHPGMFSSVSQFVRLVPLNFRILRKKKIKKFDDSDNANYLFIICRKNFTGR